MTEKDLKIINSKKGIEALLHQNRFDIKKAINSM